MEVSFEKLKKKYFLNKIPSSYCFSNQVNGYNRIFEIHFSIYSYQFDFYDACQSADYSSITSS